MALKKTTKALIQAFKTRNQVRFPYQREKGSAVRKQAAYDLNRQRKMLGTKKSSGVERKSAVKARALFGMRKPGGKYKGQFVLNKAATT